MEVAQDHDVPGVQGAGRAGARQHASLGGPAGEQAPGDARRDVARDVDVDWFHKGSDGESLATRGEIPRMIAYSSSTPSRAQDPGQGGWPSR